MSEVVNLVPGNPGNAKTDNVIRQPMMPQSEFGWIPASAGMTAFFCGMLKNAVLAVEEKCCDAAYVTLGDITNSDIPTKAGIQSERNCNPASRELTGFCGGRLIIATSAREAKCFDTAYAALRDTTNPVIPAKAGIQSERNYNPALVEMTIISTNKNILTDFPALPELYQ